MTKYHVNERGEVRVCKAKGVCPLNGSSFDSKEEVMSYLEEKYTQMGRMEEKVAGREYSQFEALQRGTFVQRETDIALRQKRDTLSMYFDPSEGWAEERIALHNEILSDVMKKYKNVPSEGKVIMSGGLPGAGKTTILNKFMKIDSESYVTISSDDFKEELARRGAIPEIEGLSPMECSTLAHEESSYLADMLLRKASSENKNIIYDFTCKNETNTRRRIDSLVSAGYKSTEIQLVFADITVDVARERAKVRYKVGLNKDPIGGRYLPTQIIDKCKPNGDLLSSMNAETLVAISEDKGYNLKKPIIYDNSGVGPVRVDFDKFKVGGY